MTDLNVLASLLTASTQRRVTAIRMSGLGAFGIPMFEHITELRGFNWQKTRAEVVADIRAGATYYTDEDLGPRAILEVVQSELSQRSLCTHDARLHEGEQSPEPSALLNLENRARLGKSEAGHQSTRRPQAVQASSLLGHPSRLAASTEV
jgi:hypothetical protein